MTGQMFNASTGHGNRVIFDPGPVPTPSEWDRLIAQRVRAIAALHAAAQWLADHPEVPVPQEITMFARPPYPYGSTDDARVAAVDRLHEQHPGQRYAIGEHEYAKIPLGSENTHGVGITYVLSTTRTEGPAS